MHDQSAADLYLDLMARMLTRYDFEGRDVTVTLPGGSFPSYLWEVIRSELKGRDVRMVERGEFDAARREEGRDWPADAETMIGLKRLANVRECVERTLADGVPGDLVETGVWRGGASIYMRGILKAHGVTDRTVWLADSFAGLPASDGRYAEDHGDQLHTRDELAVTADDVRDNFRRYDLLDDQVQFLVGWFKDTLPAAPIEKVAVLRLDGDMYGSTMDALNALYDKVSSGGYLIVDDYGAIAACAQAIEDFRTEHGIDEPLNRIDWTGVYWRKA